MVATLAAGPEASRPGTAGEKLRLELAANYWLGLVSQSINASAPRQFGAPLGIARPTTVDMYPRPAGTTGAGTATKLWSSARAALSLASGSHAPQTSPVLRAASMRR